MNLYYTATQGYNEDQPNPDRSLGGYKSATLVMNDDFGNMFDEISIMAIRSGRDEYRAIIIANEFTTQISNLTVKITTTDDAICTYKLGVAALNKVDKYNRHFMENVATINTKPLHTTFVEMIPEEQLQIGNLESGAEVGLWICRHIDQEAARKQYEDVCEPDLEVDPTGRVYKEVKHPTVESINLEFSWI